MTTLIRLVIAAAWLGAGLARAQQPAPPNPTDIQAAIDTLRDVYDRDYAASEKDAAGKKALAQKLFDLAPKRKSPAMIFACYEESRRLGAAGGDVKITLAAVAALNRQFPTAPRTDLRETLKALTDADVPKSDAAALTRFAREEAASALDREDYVAAAEFAGLAAAAAKKSEDPDLALETREYRAKLEALGKARETVKATPNDPAANTVLGNYWVFDRGNWQMGLKHLARGSDKALAEAAAKDLAAPKTAKDRTAVGELWQKLAKDAPAARKRHYAERAWEWYTAALAVATGDDDLKPSERAKELELAYPDLFDKTFTGHTSAVAAVAVSPDGKMVISVGNDNSVRVWDTSGKQLTTLEGHTAWVGSVVITPDGSKAITAGGDNIIRVWDLKSFKQIDSLEGHTVAIRGLALTPDGRYLASAASDKSARLWDLTTGQLVKKFGNESDSLESVAITADGKRILAGSETGVVTVYDVKSGEVMSKFDKHGGTMIYAIAVTKDGKTAISGARDRTIRVWDVATGKELRALTGHTEQVYQLALSPDEKHILSASFDKTLRVWDFATGRELKKFEGHTDGIQGACYSPDGRAAYSASWDKTVRKWRIPTTFAAPPKKVD